MYGNLDVTGTISSAAAIAAGSASLGDVRITGKLTTPPGATPADYVFEPEYTLAPLAEIEAFTKANKHLPEVPSAAEMTASGVDVAAMNMVLLKKVEELTLHAIAQESAWTSSKNRSNSCARNDRIDRLSGGVGGPIFVARRAAPGQGARLQGGCDVAFALEGRVPDPGRRNRQSASSFV
ncbi:MAG: hypothetical protein IPN71_16380 [Fibrobacteres bacterium]|nr:hypothetical protein [Fibrobacterota bacterium]